MIVTQLFPIFIEQESLLYLEKVLLTSKNCFWDCVILYMILILTTLFRQTINAFLDGTFPINTSLPAERELAGMIGVTRTTLREALQRLERDGWVEIQHGKPTRVRDFWTEGNLGVTIALAQYQDPLPNDFVAGLFAIRILLAPTYFYAAVANQPEKVINFLDTSKNLTDSAEDFADFDWKLHWQLTVFAGNPF